MPREKRLMPASKCDRRSFRVIKSGKKQVRVCCARGKWDAKRGRCRGPMKAQVVIKPKRGMGVVIADDIKSVRIVKD